MSIHLRLELDSKQEIKDWESVKKFLGLRSNTEALRVLIKRTALEAEEIAVRNQKSEVIA